MFVLCTGFGRKEVVEYLLENGADVNAHDDGRSCRIKVEF